MNSININGSSPSFNHDVYMVTSFTDWNREVARRLAERDGLVLSDCHWIAINFLREFYLEYEVPPSDRLMIKILREKVLEYGCTKKTLQQIFPKGGHRQACRLAGLPDVYCHSC
jgi:TusE/DsrC/DsvC family sulfur relay protein